MILHKNMYFWLLKNFILVCFIRLICYDDKFQIANDRIYKSLILIFDFNFARSNLTLSYNNRYSTAFLSLPWMKNSTVILTYSDSTVILLSIFLCIYFKQRYIVKDNIVLEIIVWKVNVIKMYTYIN